MIAPGSRPEYYVRTGSMLENPHGVPRDEVVRMILDNPPEVTAQTVFGKYVEASGLVFSGELIQMLFDRTLPIVRGGSYVAEGAVQEARDFWLTKRWWGNRYHTGIDFARKTDYTVIHVLDCRSLPARTVYWRRLNRVPWETIYAEVGRAVHYFGSSVLFDATGPGGDVISDALESRTYCPLHHRVNLTNSRCMDGDTPLPCRREDYIPLSCCEPFQFTGLSKVDLVENLRNVMSVGSHKRLSGAPFGWIRCPGMPQLEEELTFYAWEDKRLQTDSLFGLALAAWSGLFERVGTSAVGSPYGN